jgi:hypothetical protein
MRKDGILCRFLPSLASLCPEAYHAGKVLVFATTFPNDVDSNVVDDYERLFIGLLGFKLLLNRQQVAIMTALLFQANTK